MHVRVACLHLVVVSFVRCDEAHRAPTSPREMTAEVWDMQRLLAERRQLTAANVALNYSKNPLHIVRGRGQFLYEEGEAEPLLDGVNNVCHVGHCHPDVVAATVSQLQTLNTNSRYLHTTLLEASR